MSSSSSDTGQIHQALLRIFSPVTLRERSVTINYERRQSITKFFGRHSLRELSVQLLSGFSLELCAWIFNLHPLLAGAKTPVQGKSFSIPAAKMMERPYYSLPENVRQQRTTGARYEINIQILINIIFWKSTRRRRPRREKPSFVSLLKRKVEQGKIVWEAKNGFCSVLCLRFANSYFSGQTWENLGE